MEMRRVRWKTRREKLGMCRGMTPGNGGGNIKAKAGPKLRASFMKEEFP